jgi:hypothetical protein
MIPYEIRARSSQEACRLAIVGNTIGHECPRFTIAPSPIVTAPTIIAPAPTQTSLPKVAPASRYLGTTGQW